jgi:quercetin dioxygenase-like cupin family protein
MNNMQKRVFENPLIKDKVTLVESSSETAGAYSLVEVELAAGGGNGRHYHTTFDEEFTAVDGVLGIDLEKEQLRIQPGQQAIAPLGKIHRFYNPGDKAIRFLVKIVPGNIRFEQALAIAYGLAGDGLVTKKGVPKNFDHAALLLTLSDTGLPGFLTFIRPILKWRAAKATRKGMDQELIRKYC